MLEIVEFNDKLFRYRPELQGQGIVYNLRYGTIYIVKGNAKAFIEQIISQGSISVNIENRAINFLIHENILKKVES